MSIERLTTAARAAGYAMATCEDLLTPRPIQKAGNPWRVADAKLLQETLGSGDETQSYTGRLKEVVGFITGRVTA